jgi:hypothetical protein
MRQAVRFCGYDHARQWPFFITAEALRRLHPAMAHSEAGMLEAFDSHRDRICATAVKLYSWGQSSSYGPGVAEI